MLLRPCRLILMLFLATLTQSHVAAAPLPVRYIVTDLGTLPGGHSSRASGLNNRGQVVGWSDTGATKGVLTVHAFLWEHGRMRDIDTLSDHQKAPGTVARGINDHGVVVGGVELIAQEGTILNYIYNTTGWLWKNGHVQVVGGDALAVNNAGQVLVSDGTHSLVWQAGRTSAIRPVAGSLSVTVAALNSHGDMAGYCQNGSGDTKGFVRLDGRDVLVGALPGHNTSRVSALNDHRQAVGTSSDTSGTRSSRSFFWENGKLTDLGETSASGLGDRGQVVGSLFQPSAAGGTSKAFLWQDGRFTDLNGLIAKDAGWDLENAAAINSSGQIIGYGEHDGQRRAFLLTPLRKP